MSERELSVGQIGEGWCWQMDGRGERAEFLSVVSLGKVVGVKW